MNKSALMFGFVALISFAFTANANAFWRCYMDSPQGADILITPIFTPEFGGTPTVTTLGTETLVLTIDPIGNPQVNAEFKVYLNTTDLSKAAPRLDLKTVVQVARESDGQVPGLAATFNQGPDYYHLDCLIPQY